MIRAFVNSVTLQPENSPGPTGRWIVEHCGHFVGRLNDDSFATISLGPDSTVFIDAADLTARNIEDAVGDAILVRVALNLPTLASPLTKSEILFPRYEKL